MPSEHGAARPGGLRREHLVAAALVTATTIVLGFASGFGVVEVGVGDPQAGSGGAVAAPPGTPQVAPPVAGAPPAGAVPRGGQQVGVRPGSHRVSGLAPGSGPGPGPASGFEDVPGFGQLPIYRPPAAPPGGDPAAPPAGPAAPGPQCPPGILDSLLALVAQLLQGTTPAAALARSEALTPGAGLAPMGKTGAAEVPTLLPFGDRFVPVLGLMPLLDTIAGRGQARGVPLPPLAAPVPGPAAASTAPPADDPGAAGQLGRLAELLAPLGLKLDLVTGATDPLLVPVLGSLGCGGLVPAEPAGEVR
jgi:hypothetical protein